MARTPNSKNLNQADFCKAVAKDRLALQRYRENRRDMVREYAGFRWSAEGARKKVPLNLLALYVTTVTRSLIANNPRVLLSTFNHAGKASVDAMGEWMNQEIAKLGLMETFQRIITDALFSVGIAKMGLANPAQAAQLGYSLAAGQPFLAPVDLDDFAVDMQAREFCESDYIGHRYRVPLEAVQDSKAFARSRSDLVASDTSPYNAQGDERIQMLGQTYYALNSREHRPYVDLWEFYFPSRKLIWTLADDRMTGPNGTLKPLLEQEWIGPDEGPYRFLKLKLIPGNLMPGAPLQDLFDLHLDCNESYRKVIRQAARMKQLNLYRRGGDDTAKEMKNANDGDWVGVDEPEKVQFAKGMGPSQELQQFALTLREAFNWIAGNLSVMGGLSTEAGTLGQEKILNQNSSSTIADKQGKTVKFTSECLKGLGWYWWHDPFQTRKVNHAVPGLPDITILRQVSPQDRQQVSWQELDLQVDPFSLPPTTPEQQAQQLVETVTGLVLPALPILQSQGISIDYNALLSKLGRYRNMPDLGEVVTVTAPPQQQTMDGPPQGPQGGAPGVNLPNQPREVIRRSAPQRSEAGANQQLRAKLAGVDIGGSPNGKA